MEKACNIFVKKFHLKISQKLEESKPHWSIKDVASLVFKNCIKSIQEYESISISSLFPLKGPDLSVLDRICSRERLENMLYIQSLVPLKVRQVKVQQLKIELKNDATSTVLF